MNPQPDPELELLRAGLESYLPAMNAIVAFRERIQKVCRTVMAKHLSAFATALGVELNVDDVANWSSPATQDAKDASVGAQLKKVGPDAAFLVLAVGWKLSESCKFNIGVSFYAESGAPARVAKELFHPRPVNWQDWPKAFGLQTWHTPDDAPQLEEHLTAVLERWIELWRGVGGLKAVSGK